MKSTAAMVDPYDSYSKDEEVEVDTAEWTCGKSVVSCPWVKETESAYDFYIKKPTRSLTSCWKKAVEVVIKPCDSIGKRTQREEILQVS